MHLTIANSNNIPNNKLITEILLIQQAACNVLQFALDNFEQLEEMIETDILNVQMDKEEIQKEIDKYQHIMQYNINKCKKIPKEMKTYIA